MLPDAYLIAAGIVGLFFAGGLGTLVGFQTARRSLGSNSADTTSRRRTGQGERVRRELKQCMDMADGVLRDADALSEAAMKPALGSWDKPEAELLQLRKTVKAL